MSDFEKKHTSIIVPVYNVKPYLDSCVKSILSQTFAENIEIILVDDGSTDGCAEMCDGYAAADPRVLTFHKANGGLASAVKFGVEHSSGEYLFFIDGDDEFNPRALEVMYGLLKKYQVDLICAPCISDREKVMSSTGREAVVRVVSRDEYMESIINNGNLNGRFVENSRCGKLFLASKVKANLHLYNPEVRKGEDQMMTLPMLLSCERVAVVENFYPYFYLLRRTSICGKFNPLLWEQLKKQHDQIAKIVHELAVRDLSGQLNNSLIAAAILSVGACQKCSDGLGAIYRAISKIIGDVELQNALKNPQIAPQSAPAQTAARRQKNQFHPSASDV